MKKQSDLGKIFFSALLMLLLTVFTTSSILAMGHTFSDIGDDHRSKVEIEYLANEEIINGFPDGTFRPSENITRGQVALIIARSLDLIELDGTLLSHNVGSGFPDVAESTLFYNAVIALQGEGIIQGYPDGTYRPNHFITRGEIANILAAAFDIEKTSHEYTFEDQHPAFNDAIQALYDQGFAFGISEKMFGTSQNLTREHFALFTYRILTSMDPITVDALAFNEAGDQFDITFSGLPAGLEASDVADLDQDHIVSLLTDLDLLDTVLIELNDEDVTSIVLPLLNLSTGADPLDGLTLTVDHANLNDLEATKAGDEVTLTIGGASDTYTILGH